MPDRPSSTAAGDSTWAAQPATGDWNTATNWNPTAVPTGTATFGTSSQTGIGFAPGSGATIDAIVLAAGAPPYTFLFTAPAPTTPALTIAGAGVSNGSGNNQHFVVASSAQNYKQPQLKFTNAATAGGPGTLYSVGPTTPAAAGGGVIGFYDESTAGSASFIVTTGAGTPPPKNSTVGGEVGFSDTSSAGTAHFTNYGTTGPASNSDTFGNTVFHDNSTAANAVFTSIGGTVPGTNSYPNRGGDGGNTQFYDKATAGNAVFHNMGATAVFANGGDVAFDGTATAADGVFHNYPATASGGAGGVTSFNNNCPYLQSIAEGASAGRGYFYNYGAKVAGAGGGHTSFAARFGSPTADHGTFVNYGSAIAKGPSSSAGRTIFAIIAGEKCWDGTTPPAGAYSTTAANGVFWNFPGTAADAPGGSTEFQPPTNGSGSGGSAGPTAGNGTFFNLGAYTPGALGGQTWFSGPSSAGNATLIATGGVNGGAGGMISFSEQASGGTATISLVGNGTLDVSHSTQPSLTLNSLELAPGCIVTSLGTFTPCVAVSGLLTLGATPAAFAFKSGKGFATGTWYTILSVPNLSTFTAQQFTGNSLNGVSPTFRIVGTKLQVSFGGQ